MNTPKFNVEKENDLEHRVKVTRGKKVVADVVVCMGRAELDAFLLGCRLIEEILEKSKGAGNEKA